MSSSRNLEEYSKVITASDAGDRLNVSSKRLDDGFFELPDGERPREVVAFDAKGELGPWILHLRIRPQGYRKPVISGDWLNFVREKNVQAGDTVVFFKEYYYDQATGREMPMRYKIGVKIEEIELFGKFHAVVR
ncbi:hypothetical protein WN944_008407 [Citrus x changshan-huyou]|uniref:TF-B3 domain-containing protein n=1 Tax=Citrus x changshan-huyou TaxID=2935761 RepID=A0AAP0MQB1_9ROSI